MDSSQLRQYVDAHNRQVAHIRMLQAEITRCRSEEHTQILQQAYDALCLSKNHITDTAVLQQLDDACVHIRTLTPIVHHASGNSASRNQGAAASLGDNMGSP